MGFLSKTKLKASELMEQAITFLVTKYEQAGQVFTPASPFGQLLSVIANISELVFTYVAHTAEEMNIETAQNVETIHGLANLAGHVAYRGGSAYGMMRVRLNDGASEEIKGNYVKINNFTVFQIAETGVDYFLNLPSDTIKLSLSDSNPIGLYYIQGTPETQTFTSDGTALQSFNPVVKTMTDHNNVSVAVNGKEWKRVESLYDMPADDGGEDCECYIVRSSVNIGLSIFFGNGNFGKIPPRGATIDVTYIKTNGNAGNANVSNVTYVFTGTGTDEQGNEVNLNDILDIDTVYPPTMGSDFEDPEFTKVIAPLASKSFVLATPENYVSFLSKYNQYSYIRAFNTKDDDNIDDDNVTYLKIIPNIKKKLSSNQDYFAVPEKEFILDDVEKMCIQQALEDSGRMLINSEVSIIDPEIRRFAINVFIKYFEGADKNSIRTEIRNIFNTYFLNINRNDIIPLSDLIGLVEGISGVDTCSVFFVNEYNEKAIIDGKYDDYVIEENPLNGEYEKTKKTILVPSGSDPKLGFDNFGNIIIDNGYIYIPKGGWRDRYNNYYTETPETGKLGPLNIFFTDRVEAGVYTQTLQRKLNNLLKDNQ